MTALPKAIGASTAAAAGAPVKAGTKPDCILCGGKGWTMRRVEIPFIGGVEMAPCKCRVAIEG